MASVAWVVGRSIMNRSVAKSALKRPKVKALCPAAASCALTAAGRKALSDLIVRLPRLLSAKAA
jgi:hypothetical protein